MSLLRCVLLVAISCGLVTSQAPKDVSQYCIDNALVPDYPPTVKPLMDSWSYQYLLGENGVWQSINLDQYHESWISSEDGESCSNTVQVLEPSNFPQDNWLITQHIAKSVNKSDIHPTRVHVNLTFKIDSSCENCEDTFQVLLYYTNSSVADISNKTNSFSLIANLTHTSSDQTSEMAMNTFVISPDQTGFYLALRDFGSNITVFRFLVYRLIGPAKQVGLTLFPETPTALNSVSVSGLCVANANTTTGNLPELNLQPDGTWVDGEEQCFCIEGHEPQTLENLKQCMACTPGTYKSLKDNSDCLTCPDNSGSSVHGASICPCNAFYYRAPGETADIKCTEPPSAPLGLRTLKVTNSTITLAWEEPSSLGERSDTFYNIFLYSSGHGNQLEQINDAPVINRVFEATNLTADTLYQLIVVSENGVSAQAGNQNQRSSIAIVRTDYNVPPQISTVNVVIMGSYVDWSTVSGQVDGYEIQLFSSEDDGIINSVDDSMPYYEVNVTEDFPSSGQPVNVRVRAINNKGNGKWSDPVLFAKINSLAPTATSSLVPTTTTPPFTTPSSSSPQSTNTSSATTTNTTTKSTRSTGTSSTYIVVLTSSTLTSSTYILTSTSSPTPTQNSEATSPAVAIGAVIGGAIGIIVLVGIFALIYFLFRRWRLKRQNKQDDIDYAQLVHYDAQATDSEDESRQIRLKLKNESDDL